MTGSSRAVRREDPPPTEGLNDFEDPATQTIPAPAPTRAPALEIVPPPQTPCTEARDALMADALAAPPDERILRELAAAEVPLALRLLDVQRQLADRLYVLVDHPTQALMLAKVFREVVGASTVVTKRVQSMLGAAGNLRAQRRFLRLRENTTDGSDDEG
jgi:hypothetical protein